MAKSFCCLPMRHGQYTWKTIVHNIIISVQFIKKHSFLSYKQGYRKSGKIGRQIYNTLPSEQFSTNFVVCCVVTRLIVKPTNVMKQEFRQKSYEMQLFY